MIQWFRGNIEACYVGTPISAAIAQRAGANHFKPRLYRALVRDVVLIDPPANPAAGAASPPASDAITDRAPADLRAARIDSGVVAGVRGPGSSYEGPLFEVEIGAARFRRGTVKDGKSYGIVTGEVIGYCELPPPPPKPEVKTTLVVDAAPAEALTAELRQAPEGQSHTAVPAAASAQPAASAIAAQHDVDDESEPPPPVAAPARAKPERMDSAALPLTSAAAAIAIALWVTGGAAPALLWSVFLLPTLIARKLFHGVLRDSDGIRGFGIALIITQLFCASSLISSWWALECKPLSLLPLIGLVAVIFPSGLLPSALPLCLNAAGLALVLAFWGGGGDHCPGAGPRAPAAPSAPPSVEHPGVPRTNPDGSWPKRPPG